MNELTYNAKLSDQSKAVLGPDEAGNFYRVVQQVVDPDKNKTYLTMVRVDESGLNEYETD